MFHTIISYLLADTINTSWLIYVQFLRQRVTIFPLKLSFKLAQCIRF